MTSMNIGGPEWIKWCANYEMIAERKRIREERRIRRDRLAKLAADDAKNAGSTYTKSAQ